MIKRIINFLTNEHNKKLLLLMVICGGLFGFFYQTMAMDDAKNKFKEFSETIVVVQKVTTVSLDIPIKDTYLLKLKGGPKEGNQPEKVFINDYPLNVHLLAEYRLRKRQPRRTEYRIIPPDLIYAGKNLLKICYYDDYFPFELSISCRNYRKELNDKHIFILFDSSRYLSRIYEARAVSIKILFGILFICGLWIVISSGWARILYISERKIYLYSLLSFTPSLLILSVFYLSSICSPYHIALSVGYFWSFVIILVCISNVYLISRGIWFGYKNSGHLFKAPSLPQFKTPSLPRYRISPFLQYLKYRVLKPVIFNQNVLKSIDWVKDQELCDKLILSFTALLIMGVLLLLLGLEPVAEQFARVAYFALGAGIVIKFVKLIKEERARDKKD